MGTSGKPPPIWPDLPKGPRSITPWSHRAFSLWSTVTESYNHRNLFTLAGEAYNRIAYTHNWVANMVLYRFREDVDVYIDPREFYLLDAYPGPAFANDADIARHGRHLLFHNYSGPEMKKIAGSLFFSLVNRIRIDAYNEHASMGEYANLYPRGLPQVMKSEFLLEHAIDGIQDVVTHSRQPFLVYFHLMPPHRPYNPRREFIGRFNDKWTPVAKKPHFFSQGHSNKFLNRKRRQYDEYIAYADSEFGRLYDFMAQAGLLDNTYLVLTSDHGEMFERGIIAHITPVLYEPLVHIPLLISKPGQRQREDVYTPTSCIDLLPTLLHVTGRTIPDWCEGEMLPTFGNHAADGERSIFSVEAKENPKHAALTKGTMALIKGRYKLIHYFGYDGYENEYELYDLVNDPEEVENLYPSKKSIAADLRRELKKKQRKVNQPYY
jgi:hypothetical protein